MTINARIPRFLPGQDLAPNRWDWVLLPLVLTLIAAAAFGASQMARPYAIGAQPPMSLNPLNLPYDLLRTMLRMFIALSFSLVFSFVFAALAAKSRAAERILVPMVDVCQSVPILGFQAIAVVPFMALFPGNLLGVECAAIFAIFTSQAWNMALSLYQSFRTVPVELDEATRAFRLSPWQRFWRLELPFAMPGLLWNMMMSMSGGWFFLVAAEAISVAGQDIKLPGIGSYIAVAIEQRDIMAVGWAVLAMFVGIMIYDQLFFRPLLAWADKFRFEENLGNEPRQHSWVLDWGRRSRLTRTLAESIGTGLGHMVGWFPRRVTRSANGARGWGNPPAWVGKAWQTAVMLLALVAVAGLVHFIRQSVSFGEVLHVIWLGACTLLRVVVLMACACLFWVPVGVYIGLNPAYSQRVQAIAQFVAAFPVNLLFPFVVLAIVTWHLNPNIWLSPLIVFGTQWYLLFNIVAGASVIPAELRFAGQNLGLKGWLKWKRLYLPAVFPSLVTGLITASGGSWNASIVAEYVTWGDTTLKADGLGSYIQEMTTAGDFHRIALGIGVMCIYVMLLNRLVWSRLYQKAEGSRL